MLGRALYDRGVTHGRTGNLSMRCGDRVVLTPTNVSLGRLDPAQLAIVDLHGEHLGGADPTKELPLHLAFYLRDAELDAVVHTHSTYATAVSVLADVDPTQPIAALTAYFAMRVGTMPLVPYIAPGDPALAHAISSLPHGVRCALLANHGPVAAAKSLEAAVDAIEEIEETARLTLLLHGREQAPLAEDEALRLSRARR